MRNIFGPILASGLLMAAAHAADSETTTYSCDYALPVKSADDPSITVKEYIPFSYYVDAQREPTYTLMPPFATFSRNRWEFAILYTGPIILIKGGHVPEDLAYAAEMKLAGDLGQKRTD